MLTLGKWAFAHSSTIFKKWKPFPENPICQLIANGHPKPYTQQYKAEYRKTHSDTLNLKLCCRINFPLRLIRVIPYCSFDICSRVGPIRVTFFDSKAFTKKCSQPISSHLLPRVCIRPFPSQNHDQDYYAQVTFLMSSLNLKLCCHYPLWLISVIPYRSFDIWL